MQDELLAVGSLLEQFGPRLGRPSVDSLHDSRHHSMKEVRFDAEDGVWRFAFTLYPKRHGIILCGGDNLGGSEKRFYRQLIEKVDARYDPHLARVKGQEMKQKKGKRP